MSIVRRSPRNEIASFFIREFTRHLIINSKPKSSIDPTLIERVKRKLENKGEILMPSLLKSPKSQIPRMQMPPRRMPPFMVPKPMPPRKTMATPIQKTQPVTRPTQVINELNLGKLQSLIFDKSVTGVECSGTEKNILVNKAGLVQAIGLTLKGDEIASILKEFSDKTKIPLMPGVFKAVYNNLLITAVISEIAGNRFIIEKHFGQLQLPKKE